MGYQTTRFVCSVDQNLLCAICAAVLEDAVLTDCGHCFCAACLETWISRVGGTGTCPECRSAVSRDAVRPVRAIRNYISSMTVHCDNNSRGCRHVVKLDMLASHLGSCSFQPVDCAGCGQSMSRRELPEHHIRCDVIRASAEEDTQPGMRPAGTSRLKRHVSLRRGRTQGLVTSPLGTVEMTVRVATLEVQLRKIKRSLEAAEAANSALETELHKTREDLKVKRSQLFDQQYTDYDPDYEYGYLPGTVQKLSGLIARFLRKKPVYIDKQKVFNCIQRCYDRYGRSDTDTEQDVHMLLATACACDWFSEAERLQLHCWLQIVGRYRDFHTRRRRSFTLLPSA